MMVAKKVIKAPAKKQTSDPKALRVNAKGDENLDARMAAIAYDPAARSFVGAGGFIECLMGEQTLTESLMALTAQIKDVQAGSLASAERTLVAQANTLDAIFNEMARRAALNMGEYLNATETYLRLALKAQSQCRATISALVDLKYPRQATFVKQANIAHGPQQVNNGAAPAGAISHAEENKTEQNKLLEDKSHERPYLDIGATPAATRGHQAMEAVGKVHRAKKPRG